MTQEAPSVSELPKGLAALADDLTMFASQLQEAVAGQGSPPSPWTLDDWMTRYREAVR